MLLSTSDGDRSIRSQSSLACADSSRASTAKAVPAGKVAAGPAARPELKPRQCETAKTGNINPQAYLTHILKRIADHPIHRIDALLPWLWTQ